MVFHSQPHPCRVEPNAPCWCKLKPTHPFTAETKPHALFVGVKPKRTHPKWVVDGDEGDGGVRDGDDEMVVRWDGEGCDEGGGEVCQLWCGEGGRKWW
ncbi:hypothetical protein Tco_1169546 [Tanacetum coccineum]